jgi:hypothetical protein
MELRRSTVVFALLFAGIGASPLWIAVAGSPHVLLDVPPVRFHGVVQGRPTEKSISVTNLMNDPVTIKAISIDWAPKTMVISGNCSVPLTLAPAEQLDVPVTLSGKRGSGQARLRIVVTTPRFKQDTVTFIKFHYEVK